MLLHLLKRDIEGGRGSIKIEGVHWKLAAQNLDTSEANNTRFTCVSYAWGMGRERSPLHPSFDISDRTLPSLNAALGHRTSCTAIWIDAFCVPHHLPERTSTLESMGFIYSRAEEVIVVLSNAARPALEQMSASDHIDPINLDILEQEEWISRAWTYQEAVNSRTLFITCEDSQGAIIDASHFLNCLGYALSRLDGSGLMNFKRQQYPRLDAFEDLIADYMIADYQERSALQVMSNMDRRTQQDPQDHFYAMIGAISTVRASASEVSDPCETFMALCETKGDYSFIYSTAKRDPKKSRGWRPVSTGDLPSILPWHCFGDGQPGHEDEEGCLYLDSMLLMDNLPINENGKQCIERWLAFSKARVVGSSEPLQKSAYAALREMDFNGSSEHVSTRHGFFFPVERIVTEREITILVATKVRWAFGAPSLARCYDGDIELYVPGVFFGYLDETAAISVKVS